MTATYNANDIINGLNEWLKGLIEDRKKNEPTEVTVLDKEPTTNRVTLKAQGHNTMLTPAFYPLKLSDRERWLDKVKSLGLQVRYSANVNGSSTHIPAMVSLVKAAEDLNISEPPGGWRRACRTLGLSEPHYLNETNPNGMPGTILVSVDGLAHLMNNLFLLNETITADGGF